ncbi:MAG: NAD(P)H-hydrate dehydratase [Myxococcales bacterium]|nr:NAD(P)H-hydrate dehydratase [Myxococcota bacterium]MDW8281144.1 NAD(P)H-hydrate dehydratase [Myxococcales bacterium]
MIPVVTAAQMRALDAETIEHLGVPGAVLMETAGRAVVARMWELHRAGAFDLLHGSHVLIAAGPGNNGGDGMVIGRYLHTAGVSVRLLLCAERERVRGDALIHLRAAEAVGLTVQVCAGEAGAAEAANRLRALGPRDVIVDALLGTGLDRAVSGPLARVIHAINASPATRIAVDLPSGLDADRGEPAGTNPHDPAIVRAHHTVTFAFPKLGLVSAPGFTYAGTIAVADIGIPTALCARHGVSTSLLDARCLHPVLVPRAPLGHKGTHGHLLVLAGSTGHTGAALLCAEAAQRVGVGLCTIAAPADVQPALQGRVLETMTASYTIGPGVQEELCALAEGKRALAVGPGFPTHPTLGPALVALLRRGDQPAVLDADALNVLVPYVAELRQVQRPLVLTPHPGEAGRLLGTSPAAVQADRVGAARALAQLTGAVVLLKGARTLIAAPGSEGKGDGPLAVCPTGSAALGTGGMGDVLTGVVGALLCRGLPTFSAACAAAYWHGLAGDLAARERPPGSLVLASEVCARLPAALAAAAAAPEPLPFQPLTFL